MQTTNVWKQRGTSPSPSSDVSRRSARTTEQSMFLQRLAEMLEKRREIEGRLSRNDWRFRLLDKALYSTYCDCVDLGVGDEARRLVNGGVKVSAA